MWILIHSQGLLPEFPTKIMANKLILRLSNFTIHGAGNTGLKDPLITPNCVACTQFVRWRKRRWAPRAKSKMYYVRQPTPQDAEEKEFLIQANAHYSTVIKALMEYFKKTQAAAEAREVSEAVLAVERKGWEKLLRINVAWNEESATLRSDRLVHGQKAEELQTLAKFQREEEWMNDWRAKVQQKVGSEIEKEPDFIDVNNLESAIEEALNKRVNYNYCLDPTGHKYIEQSDGTLLQEDTEESSSTAGAISSS